MAYKSNFVREACVAQQTSGEALFCPRSPGDVEDELTAVSTSTWTIRAHPLEISNFSSSNKEAHLENCFRLGFVISFVCGRKMKMGTRIATEKPLFTWAPNTATGEITWLRMTFPVNDNICKSQTKARTWLFLRSPLLSLLFSPIP